MRSAFSIRDLLRPAQLAPVERIQLRVWGRDERAVAGRNLLAACVTAGGLVAGAFVREGARERMAGFVYGFWARRRSERVFWSHMLAVLPRYRRLGIGRALKLHQKRFVRRAGVRFVEWTFDPLRAGNAYFNLHRLGAVSREYLVDHYGDMDDGLNWGLPTDRLVARWDVTSPDDPPRRPREDAGGFPALAPRSGGALPRPGPVRVSPRGGTAAVAVPSDIAAVKRASLAVARRWRQATRRALRALLGRGFVAHDFLPGRPVGWYVLAPGPGAGDRTR